jgi:hypothetical protein
MHTSPDLPNLPPSVAREVYANLCDLLPSPRTAAQEDRDARDETAMAAVAALYPADAFEALLAAEIVGADACAKDSLRLAVQPGQSLATIFRCRAQASAMMRHAQGGYRALQRRQWVREKAEAAMHPAAMERAGWWFRDASVPAPDEAPEPGAGEGRAAGQMEAGQMEAAQPAAPPPAVAPPSVPPPGPAPGRPGFSDLTEAEQYAVIYPARAALIRANGGLPATVNAGLDPTFGPPEPELVEALVSGTSRILLALDQPARAAAAA